VCAFNFPQCVRSNPSGRASFLLADASRASDGCAIEPPMALADLPQRPIHGLSDEIALIVRVSLDKR
jgi:hypothetical protein